MTVFERADRPGGLLMYGLPNMKLDKQVVRRRIDLMTEEGIRFITNTRVGHDLPAHQLMEQFDAVVLCGGATLARAAGTGKSPSQIRFAKTCFAKSCEPG